MKADQNGQQVQVSNQWRRDLQKLKGCTKDMEE